MKDLSTKETNSNKIGSKQTNSQKIDKIRQLRVALVHDFLTTDGGAEQVLRVLHDIWSQSTVYTPLYLKKVFTDDFEDWEIRTSFVDRLPFKYKLHNQYKLFFNIAVEQFQLNDFDLVLSHTFAGYAKGVIVKPGVKHICYMHNVPRYLWGLRTALQKTLHPIYRNVIMPPLKHIWRIWDRQTSQRPDVLLANSHTVQKRIQKFYRRKSTVLYPPVKVKSFLAASREINNKKDFFIYFGRLEKYKNVDMAIRACVKHKQKLKIIGVGSAKKNLEQLVQELEGEKYVEFLGWVEFQKLKEIVAQAKAFIFPCFDEDFGIVPVESMAAGTPVIGFNGGGITETVINGKTGILLEDFSQQSLDEAVANFDEQSFLKKRCQSRAKEFSTSQFNQNLMDIVGSHL